MTRNGLFALSGVLALTGVMCLGLAMSLKPDLTSYLDDHYTRYASNSDGTRYECAGSPATVADELSRNQEPEARAADRGTQYLRYDDEIVSIGPDTNRPCTIRAEGLDGRYSGGSFIFLGPGFTPGSPAGGSGGSPGGPDGTK